MLRVCCVDDAWILKKKKVKELNSGDTFEYDDRTYMVVEVDNLKGYRAANLVSGYVLEFSGETVVYPVMTEVKWKHMIEEN